MQSGFMPVVALGFSVAPVAGQNVGAGLPDRVKKTFFTAAGMAAGAMAVWGLACWALAPPMVRVFSSDAQVVAVGSEYLEYMAWAFVGSGVVFVSSSMFQALGNTIPSLAASFARLMVVAIPAVLVSRMPGFELRWIWYLSGGSIFVQMVTVLVLLRREFRLRFAPGVMLPASSATAEYADPTPSAPRNRLADDVERRSEPLESRDLPMRLLAPVPELLRNHFSVGLSP